VAEPLSRIAGTKITYWILALFIILTLMLFATKASALVVIFRSNVCAFEVGRVTLEETALHTIPCAESLLASESHQSIILADGVRADEERLGYLERLSQSTQFHPVVQLQLGHLLWRSGKAMRAVEAWRRAQGVDVYFANQSALQVAAGHLSEGQGLAELAQIIDPTVKVEKRAMYESLCKAWQEAKRPESALSWCESFAQAMGNGWAQIALAEVRMDMGDYEGALRALQWALELQRPDSMGSAYKKLGQVYVKLGRLEEGIAAYRTALRLGFSNKWIYVELARALLRSGDFEAACQSFARARSLGYVPSPKDRIGFANCGLQE